jgi:hexosaminidase
MLNTYLIWKLLWATLLFPHTTDAPFLEKENEDAVSTALNLIPAVHNIEFYAQNPIAVNAQTVIHYEKNTLQEAIYLQNIITQAATFKPRLKELIASESPKKGGIYLRANASFDRNPESYSMDIDNGIIEISGATKQGLMRGIQTFRQLFSLEVYHNEKQAEWWLPAIVINDAPKFKHRGLLLDVCRHFFEIDVLKKYIDLLAFYRMNILHLHLTEDQAWRIESKAFPKLNSHSAWRSEQDGTSYGGYYTKTELLDLVAYAETRHITIIPEIELPGHSQAALSAYPQFSCLGAEAEIEVANDWGVFKEIYCAGNDSTFIFLETILGEVMDIFPSSYIHIGGDEAPKFRWENCAKCQKRINDEHLHDEHELQRYFIQRIETFLHENNRKLIGWDEILEGGLNSSATVQSWRGMEGAIKAAKQGNEAIVSPTSHCYLDYGLDKIDLAKVYQFDPIPEGLNPQEEDYIIGGEVNMWTEHVPNENNLDRKVNPRLQAFAEVLWTYPNERDFNDFYSRIQNHYPKLSAMGIDYGPETVGASIYADLTEDKITIGAKRNLADLDLEVYWNGIKGPWGFPLSTTGVLSAYTTKKGLAYGDTIKQEFIYHMGLTRPVNYGKQYEKWYSAGGEIALVNGTIGSLNFRDGQWQGFSGTEPSFEVDLGAVKTINSVGSNFYHYTNAWIFRPERYEVSYSIDGKTWQPYGSSETNIAAETRGKHIEYLGVKAQKEARYIRVQLSCLQKVPAWHEAAGSDVWLFMDEIIVQ